MNASELLTGLPVHSTHLPLIDARVGFRSRDAAFAILGAVGFSEENMRDGKCR